MPPATRQGRDVQLARTVAAATTAAIDAQNQLQEKRKHHHTHPLIIFVLSVFALIMLLRTQGEKLQHDWTPVGIGVKFLLVACVIGLMYYPYELFLKGPDAVEQATKMSFRT